MGADRIVLALTLWLAGAAHSTGDLLISVNPSRPSDFVGQHHKATAEMANRAIEDAHAYAPHWGRTPPVERARLLTRAAALLRERKFEFDAWLVIEAGKTWPEAEAEVEWHADDQHQVGLAESVNRRRGG